MVATASAAIRAAGTVPGGSVIDPEAWWRAFARTAGRTLAQLSTRDCVRGVCLSGMTRSQVLLDRDGRPLAPALLFRDRRATDDAAEVARHFPTDNPADEITAFHPLARIAWFAHRQPKTFERIRAVLEPKDFLNFRLTGEIAADSVTYSRYDRLRATGSALPDWLQALPPPPRPPPGAAMADARTGDERASAVRPHQGHSGVRRRDGRVGHGGGLRRGARRSRLRHRGHVRSGRADHIRARRRARARVTALERGRQSDRRADAGWRRLRVVVPRCVPHSRSARGGRRACRQDDARRGSAAVPALSCGRARADLARRCAGRVRRAVAPAWCRRFSLGGAGGRGDGDARHPRACRQRVADSDARGSRCGRRGNVERVVPAQGGCHADADDPHVAARDGPRRRSDVRGGRPPLVPETRRRRERDVPRRARIRAATGARPALRAARAAP